MIAPDLLPPPQPQSSEEQMPPEEFEYITSAVGKGLIDPDGDGGYFLPGDTVVLRRNSGENDKGWAYVGVDAYDPDHGIFVKKLGGHRARKSYPFHWDRID